jgi:membrane fusion protein, multidrug efflux system
MNQKYIIGSLFFVAAAVLTLTGCSGPQASGYKAPPTPVETSTAQISKVVDRFEAVGTLDAINAITVVSQIDGAVTEIPFREGGIVQKGDLIAQLDDAQLRAEEDRAAAVRQQRQVSYDRIKSVVDQGAGAPQDLDDAAAALKVAQADLDLITARHDKTRIVAPFTGMIGARQVSIGAFLKAGDPITDLAQINQLKVTFAAPEKYYASLHEGAEVTVSTTAYASYELKGRIDVVEPVIDPITRSAKVIARVDNTDGKFRPGMSANVTAVLSERDNALTIPDEAVISEGDQTLVFVVKADSTVSRTPVFLGSRQPGSVEVIKGLEPGTVVVRAGHQKLYQGAKVMPVPHQDAAPGPLSQSR